LVLNSATSKYDSDRVTVTGDVPRLVDEIVKVLIGIGVLVVEAVIAVITPAMYSLYLCEDLTLTVILFNDSEALKSARVLKTNVLVPITVILFLVVFPLLIQTVGKAGSVCAFALKIAIKIVTRNKMNFLTLG